MQNNLSYNKKSNTNFRKTCEMRNSIISYLMKTLMGGGKKGDINITPVVLMALLFMWIYNVCCQYDK